ncbi:hypothetical protein [uncultured Rubinisphaera sp.]|uniref:hypothetical protein n=1 Tax=uncultured Rubinisphaera sp. TaxID=1678686 RepID=UPI0030D78CD1|tara:strand:- start:390 stop:974 length:585 start_codon:yes stop_codon:yes gene_type:complete
MVTYGEISWERMIGAVEKVRLRLQKTAAVLNEAHIAYALVDGNAVAAWVSRVDEAAVRNTRDVDILIRRTDLPSAITAMEAAGFVYRHAAGIDMFLDGPDAKARDAVHVVFANEKVRQEYVLPTPGVEEVELSNDVLVLTLESLVRMKLTSFRRKDQMHLIDFIDLEMVDETWPSRFQSPLSERLQELLDNPEG